MDRPATTAAAWPDGSRGAEIQGRGGLSDGEQSLQPRITHYTDRDIDSHMGQTQATEERSRCLNCGFSAPDGDDAWERIEVPGLGRMSQCPECTSTNLITGISIS